MSSLLSVIVPIYNVEKYIHKCLDSIVGQTFPDMEIILIDDGSPDRCGKTCDEYAARDARIKVIHKENRGLSAARNDGIRMATGKWIAFVDSDDWCAPDYYERLFREANDEVDVFCGDGAIFEYEKGARTRGSFSKPFFYDTREKLFELQKRVLYCGGDYLTMGVPWDKLYKTSFLKDNSLCFDTNLKSCEDLWFNFQVFGRARKVAGCVYAGYHYRPVTGSITKGYNPNKIQNGYDLLDRIYHYYAGQSIEDDMQQIIYARSLEALLTGLKCSYLHPKYSGTRKEMNQAVNEWKHKPYYQKAIYSKSNRLLAWKTVCFKYAMRLPWLWPTKVLLGVNKLVS